MSFDPIHHHDRAFEELQEAYNKLKIDYDRLRRENQRLEFELSLYDARLANDGLSTLPTVKVR